MKEILNSLKLKQSVNNKELRFNQTFSQDSLSQAITSFFGQSDLKGNIDFLKDSSFMQARDGEIGFLKEMEVLKEIKEEIKEESLKRKLSKKGTLSLSFEGDLQNKSKSFKSGN